MIIDRKRQPDPDRPIVDFPGQLGDLANVFLRRRIAVGLDAGGGVVLARPDNLLVEQEAREGILDYLRKQELIGARVDGVDESGPGRTTTVRLHVGEPEPINEEPRWSLESAAMSATRCGERSSSQSSTTSPSAAGGYRQSARGSGPLGR